MEKIPKYRKCPALYTVIQLQAWALLESADIWSPRNGILNIKFIVLIGGNVGHQSSAEVEIPNQLCSDWLITMLCIA